MNLKQIKKAIEDGHTVNWRDSGYEVIQDALGNYLIVSIDKWISISLTWSDNTTLNGDENDFFIKGKE